MSDLTALYATVLDNPADDTARLVLADWLEENNEEDFGQFLRAGVVASRFRTEPVIDSPDNFAALSQIVAVMQRRAALKIPIYRDRRRE